MLKVLKKRQLKSSPGILSALCSKSTQSQYNNTSVVTDTLDVLILSYRVSYLYSHGSSFVKLLIISSIVCGENIKRTL